MHKRKKPLPPHQDAVPAETANKQPESFVPIEHNDQMPEENLEEDNIIATRKSKRQMTAKSAGDDYIVYLVDDTPITIEETLCADVDY